MTDDQLLRYGRHLLLPQIGIEGQDNIVKARALTMCSCPSMPICGSRMWRL